MIALLKFKGCTYYVIAERRGLGALHLITVLNISNYFTQFETKYVIADMLCNV